MKKYEEAWNLKQQGMSGKDIAHSMGLSINTVDMHLKNYRRVYGLKGHFGTGICSRCGIQFTKTNASQKYCSDVCRCRTTQKINYAIKYPIQEMIAMHQSGQTSTEIANEFNLSSSTVRDYLKKNGVELNITRPLRNYVCVNCGKGYEAAKGRNKYCSKECKAEWLLKHPKYIRQCKHCGKEFTTNQIKQKLCSMDCLAVVTKTNFANETIVNQYGTQEQRKSKFESDFNGMFKGKAVYVGGFVNGDGRFNCQCLKCGTIYSLGAQIVRKKGNAECPTCDQQERIARESFNVAKSNLMNALKKVSRLKEKEQKEIQKQLNYQKSLKEYECIYCGNKFTSNRANAKCCSTECTKKYSNQCRDKARRERLKNNGKYDWSISIPKLIKRDKVCKLCGKAIDITDIKEAKGTKIAGDNYPSIDHIIPVSKGGTHTWDNVQLAHRGCNTMKNNKTDVIANNGRTQLSLNI